MAQADNQELVARLDQFYRNYYRETIGELAQQYPSERRSLHIDWNDLYQFDPDIADDYLAQPEQLQHYAEEALRVYDLPVDVSLGQAHVRIRNLPEVTEIRQIRSRDVNALVAVQGIVRKATEVRPKIEEAAFECQRCGTLTYIPQSGKFQEPHECQGCERQGPFSINYDQSSFVDAQKLRVQESPEGLRGGETPQSIDVHVEDDIAGLVTPGDHVTVTGILRIEQQGNEREKSRMFDVFMDGHSVVVEDQEFENMDITEDDKRAIVELSRDDDIYEEMVASIAPTIYGYDEEKFAIVLQLFSGVTKHLPDESRIRGDLHMLLVGDPGTGKCLAGDSRVRLADGSDHAIGDLVERHLTDPTPVDDGVYDEVDLELPSMARDGRLVTQTATRVWKREAPDNMYRIRTAAGYEIEVTPSHPLFVESGIGYLAVRADRLSVGDEIASVQTGGDPLPLTDGGRMLSTAGTPAQSRVRPDEIVAIIEVDPDDEWVYDLEVDGTHAYISNNIVSHNSQLLQYIRNIAPRSVYTSGKGSSAAGLTASAVRDDFADGNQWTLEAGALVLADKGIAAVDELDKMRCVSGDTFIHSPDHGIIPIREFALEMAEVGDIESLEHGRTIRGIDASAYTMTDDGRLVSRPISAIHEYHAPDDLIEVTLESGETIRTTEDHPFFVMDEGTREKRAAGDLSKGDWTYVPNEISSLASDGGVEIESSAEPPAIGSPLSASKAAILGYLAGDGNITYNRRGGVYGIRLTNKEDQLIEHFRTKCLETFDARPTVYPSDRRDDGIVTIQLKGKSYVEELLKDGSNLEIYDGKCLPHAVTTASREAKAAFIRALADCEGSVDQTSNNLKISSSSYRLLLGVKQLLTEFGVTSQIHHRNRSEKRDIYLLVITARHSLSRYEKQIGFTLDRKQESLAAVCSSISGDRTIIDVLPNCGELVKQAREQLRLFQSECGIAGATICNFENGDANVSFIAAEKILQSFRERKQQAQADYSRLGSEVSWSALEELRQRYHISQREIAEGLSMSQDYISEHWGNGPAFRDSIRIRLRELLSEPKNADWSPLADLVNGDVKWRRIREVTRVRSSSEFEDRIPLLRHEIADILDLPSAADAIDEARSVLETPPAADSWDELRAELDRHAISLQQIADEVGVSSATISRWFSGEIDVDNFKEIRQVAFEHLEQRRQRLSEILDKVDYRNDVCVYDLTVEGTHNFLANGMVIHNSEDRSAMHQALEQQSISISKAGINATLKSRCSLLGAANPKYGRFDQYEPIAEQIELDPALISRFDLIFTVTDQPDEERDAALADHILQTNYAGELNSQRTELSAPNISQEEVEAASGDVEPAIDPELFRKYIAYAKRNCFPTMTDEARKAIRDFYIDLRERGTDDDAPVPVTARKLEALVRLSEASARVRLSDTVEREDAERVIEVVRSSLRNIGIDPETGEFDVDMIETGTSKTQRERIKNLRTLIQEIETEYDEGAPVGEVLDRASELGMDEAKAEHEIEKLKQKGEVYEPSTNTLRTT